MLRAGCCALAAAMASAQGAHLPAQGRRLPPATITVTDLPEAGELTPIAGRVDGLADPAAHQVCIYLQSTASGGNLYNGPKPFEDAASQSPVLADGTFNYVNWWANALYDREAAFIYIVVVPKAYRGGVCDPIMGTPEAPETTPVYEAAVAWGKYPRVNNITLAITGPLPLLGQDQPIRGTVTGLPEVATNYKAHLYRREADMHLTGPIPACTEAGGVTLVAGTVAGTGTFTIENWSGEEAINLNSANLVVILTPSVAAPGPGSVHCVANAAPSASEEGEALGIPPGVLGPSLAVAEFIRPTTLVAQSATPSPTATGTATPTGPAASRSPLPAASSPAATFTPESIVKGSSGAAGTSYHAIAVTLVAAGAVAGLIMGQRRHE